MRYSIISCDRDKGCQVREPFLGESNVTLNVTLPTNCLVTGQNETRQRIRIQSNMRQWHPLVHGCGHVLYRLWRSRSVPVP